MRILLVVHYFLPHVGGMEEVVKKQAESLNALGHDVTILTCRPDAASPLQEKRDGYTIKRLRAINAIENKFGVTFPLVSPLYFFTLLKEIKNYDIVHIHDVFYMTSHMAALAAVLHKKSYYLTQHVAIVDHPSWTVILLQRLIYDIFGRFIFRHAARIVCYNTNVQNFLRRLKIPAAKLLLTYNGIDTRFFVPAKDDEKARLRKKYSLPADTPIALFVGRLVPKKGYDIVAGARSDGYLCLLVGGGAVPAGMKNLPNVRLFGPASQTQLRDLYQLSDLFVFPAVGEILTLVMQEAMASGLPVITTNDPAYRHYQLDHGLIKFVARTTDAVQRAIEHLLEEPDLRRQMSDYSRRLAVERFDWRTNYQNEYAIYNEGQS